jgi:hypothetical protein
MEGLAMQTLTLPSTKYLHGCFEYNPVTGQLRWKHRPRHHFTTTKEWKRWNARFAGTIAGSVAGNRRHWAVKLGERTYQIHRIGWKLMTGKEPPPNIDHINRDGHDNRWANLREANQTKQNWNKGLQKNNSSGYRGVSRDGGKWQATIQINRVQRHLGIFPTAREASAAYEAAARDLQGEFYRGS